MKLVLISLFLIFLQGCSAALVPYTSDPNKKLSYAYSLLNQDRPFPAERLGKESLKDFTDLNDKYGMAEAHTFMASLYKQYSIVKNPRFHVSYPDFDPKNGKVFFHAHKAIDLFLELDQRTQISKVQFVLANFYLVLNNTIKGCELYDQSIVNYQKGISKDPTTGFAISDNFRNFPEMVAAFKHDHCK